MNRVLQLLGLAQRAGKLVSGDEGVLAAVRGGKARLVIIARDASPGAVKKYSDKCRHYGVTMVQAADRQQLGRSIGKPERVAIALLDDGFAGLVRKALNHSETQIGDANPREVKDIEQTGKIEGI
jgi:ribosomal protein L7Ae-like RNA K-turn-binding protein